MPTLIIVKGTPVASNKAAPRMDELPTFARLVQQFGLFGTVLCPLPPQVDARSGELSCSCSRCATWHAFVEGRPPHGTYPQYEVLTQEHIGGLAAYLLERARHYSLPKMRVLEVGAGDGRLRHHLALSIARARARQESLPDVELVATDSGQRGLAEAAPLELRARVKVLDAEAAIGAEQPDVVIACWMPMGADWTSKMRATPSVKEYILIGEVDDGICGHPWLTWGFDGASSEEVYEEVPEGACRRLEGHGSAEGEAEEAARHQVAPYYADGWAKYVHVGLSSVQVCRTDEIWSLRHHSHTVSFVRR